MKVDLLEVLKQANASGDAESASLGAPLRIAIVTNFTDGLIAKAMKGLCRMEGLSAEIYAVPYKQYLFALKNVDAPLYQFAADITYLFFDVNPYIGSEFLQDPSHGQEVLEDIHRYAGAMKGSVVVQTMQTPPRTAHGNLFQENTLHRTAAAFNAGLETLAKKHANLFVAHTDRLMQIVGESAARDLRGLYAFSQPFSHDFILALSREWMALLRALRGKAKKCLVLDLDNTLWGGVIGEVGPLGIHLGPDYPGNAFRNFQRVLLEFYDRGIILAINSRNNPEDVKEVFEKNPHMILKEKHFSSMQINWNQKSDNLAAIAEDLNIGLDSLVFFDDDAMNRDLVRSQMPEVTVPDFSLPPEAYVDALLSLDVFHQMRLTEEDRSRGRMYAEERQRKDVQKSAKSLEEYLAQLEIRLDISLNDPAQIPRLSQLCLKTNQFNLTTRRHAESDLRHFIENRGGLVFGGDVSDKFGAYGITLEAIVLPSEEGEAELETLLMSCRVMARGVEQAFFHAIAEQLIARGISRLTATYIPTQKNPPIAPFLPSLGFVETHRDEQGSVSYQLDLADYLARYPAPASVRVEFHSSNPSL